MREAKFAKELAESARATAEVSKKDSTDGIQCGHTFNAVIVDYEQNFGDGTLNFRLFVDECDKLGYDVYPLENSILAIFSGYLEGKLVVQSKEYRQ